MKLLILIIIFLPQLFFIYKRFFADLDDLRHCLRVWLTPFSLDWIWTNREYKYEELFKDEVRVLAFLVLVLMLFIGELMLLDKLNW